MAPPGGIFFFCSLNVFEAKKNTNKGYLLFLATGSKFVIVMDVN